MFQKEPAKVKIVPKNYASSSTGASILYASQSLLNSKSILESSIDTYMNIPNCGVKVDSESPFVIVNLSEDIVVD